MHKRWKLGLRVNIGEIKMNNTNKETLRDFVTTSDRLEYLLERGLITSEEVDGARSSRYSFSVIHDAYFIICAADASEDFEGFVSQLDEVIEADSKLDYQRTAKILDQNPGLKEIYWQMEKETSAAMHNQKLRLGREMIKRKYEGN